MPPSPPLTPPQTSLILSTAYHPYAHGVPYRHALDATYHPYACECPPDMPLMLLTILTLAVTSDMPLMPLTILMLAVTSRHASDAAYHPYAHIVPSQHASDAAYHPYPCSALLK
ncbi:hypothetical protein O181_119774 [Austropuccinia psidii MF-1]|uniref:Uncharacterized protein n=1 Tax=Austropuccinia psidii MF-1 TaxID=1389203 RepID=A0A9Q3KHV2_9BASI|nr:hypothetical protein [Austropuccinia psidii MF-1]